MKIRGRAALVTGASRGLGKEVARLLALRGARVAMVAREASALEAAAEDIRKEGGHAEALDYDVGNKRDIHRIVGSANALVGPPSIVVHCASSLGPLPMPLLLDADCEDFESTLEVNLLGPFRLTKALGGSMVLAEEGTCLFASSDVAVTAYSHWGLYGTSKAAQDAMVRFLAVDHPSVRFFSVDPGEMDTKMHRDALPDADRSTLARPAEVARQFVAIIERAETLQNGARLLAADFALPESPVATEAPPAEVGIAG